LKAAIQHLHKPQRDRKTEGNLTSYGASHIFSATVELLVQSQQKKVKFPTVSIAVSQLCDLRISVHLRLQGSELQTQLSYMGGRRDLFHLAGVEAGTELYRLVTEACV